MRDAMGEIMSNDSAEMTVGDKILEAMQDALAFARGDTDKAAAYRVHTSDNEDDFNIRTIRTQLHMNRSQFAEAFGLNKYSVRNWELGERTPPEYAQSYLRIIAADPWDAYRKLHPEGC
jgi:DNA-binding transcriptional regulator YiaG